MFPALAPPPAPILVPSGPLRRDLMSGASRVGDLLILNKQLSLAALDFDAAALSRTKAAVKAAFSHHLFPLLSSQQPCVVGLG